MAEPQITLHVTLSDYSGAALGSAASPAYLRIALCGFGPRLPRVPGSSMVARIASWPGEIPFTGEQLSVKLWGNDVIAPANTLYCISILDDGKNVIQSDLYQFTGSATYDLSTATPYNAAPEPVTPTVTAAQVDVPYSTTPVCDCAAVPAGVIAFEITLTGDATSPTLVNAQGGQLVTFTIIQDGAGGHSWTWPTNVHNAAAIDPTPNAVNVQSFSARKNGHLYPIGLMTVN